MKRNKGRPSLTHRFWRYPLFAGVFCLLIAADKSGWLFVPNHNDLATYDRQNALVIQVIDGDTIEVDLPDLINNRSTTRIRTWGINCPEIGRRGKESQPYANEATAFTRSLIENKYVTLFIEPHRTRGKMNRLLAHVELTDGQNLSRELLKHGLAYADDRWPHRYLRSYEQSQLTARREIGRAHV